MSYLFENRIYFNESINDWIVHQVKNMTGMFIHARIFNQP